MILPKKYQWLSNEKSPRLLTEALKLYGVVETPGSENNPVIMRWAKELNWQDVYVKDEIPWCGLFMGVVAKRAGVPVVKNPLRALSWSTYGNVINGDPMLGDILTFVRKGGGHVGIYVGEDDTHYHVLGGNQSDAVTISRISKERLYSVNRTPWRFRQPPNVRRIFLKADGKESTNES